MSAQNRRSKAAFKRPLHLRSLRIRASQQSSKGPARYIFPPLSRPPATGVVSFESCQRDVPKSPGRKGGAGAIGGHRTFSIHISIVHAVISNGDRGGHETSTSSIPAARSRCCRAPCDVSDCNAATLSGATD